MNRRSPPPSRSPSNAKTPSSKPAKPSSSKPSSSKPSSSSSSGPKRFGRPPWEKPLAPTPRPARPLPPAHGERSSSSHQALPPDGCVYGRHAVEATLLHQPSRAEMLFHTDSPDVKALVALAQKIGVDTRLVEVADVDALAGGRERAAAQGVVLRCGPFPYADVEDFAEAPAVTLVLDGVEDPRNLGAAVRAAYALGAGLVIVPADRAEMATAAAVKTSAGALCRVPLAQVTNLRRALEQLKEKGAWIVGAEADGDRAPWAVELGEKVVLVIGGEDRGLRRLTREACDFVVAVPMAAKDMSLNAADAATLLLYEALRQRRTR
jgi:23S rRNA (guanosine2251-2'-O)-methyltransferase